MLPYATVAQVQRTRNQGWGDVAPRLARAIFRMGIHVRIVFGATLRARAISLESEPSLTSKRIINLLIASTSSRSPSVLGAVPWFEGLAIQFSFQRSGVGAEMEPL